MIIGTSQKARPRGAANALLGEEKSAKKRVRSEGSRGGASPGGGEKPPVLPGPSGSAVLRKVVKSGASDGDRRPGR